MGSGSSRGKKVAPACVSETAVSNREDNLVLSLKEDSRSFKLVKIPKFSNFTQSRNRAQQDCHSEGQDSSADEDDIDEELDRVLAEYESPRGIFSKRKSSPKKSFIRSKTYGFCNFRRVHNESNFSSTPHIPRPGETDPPPGTAVNEENLPNETECHNRDPHNDLLTRVVCVESVPRTDADQVPGRGPSMPAVLYDGSEEELMNTIERDFS